LVFSWLALTTSVFEGAPSFALFAKGGLLRSDASIPLLLILVFLFSAFPLRLCVIFFFLSLSFLSAKFFCTFSPAIFL